MPLLDQVMSHVGRMKLVCVYMLGKNLIFGLFFSRDFADIGCL